MKYSRVMSVAGYGLQLVWFLYFLSEKFTTLHVLKSLKILIEPRNFDWWERSQA